MTTSDIRDAVRAPRPRWLIVAVVVATGAFIAGGVYPAHAADVVRNPYSNTTTSVYDDCGYPATVDRTSSGTLSVRAGTGRSSSVYFLTDNYSFREVHTNLSTGQRFVIRGNGQFKNVQAKPLGSNLFEITSKNSGQPLVVEDSTGNVVLRAAGVITLRYTIDTHGDLDPTSDFVDFLGITFAGPHPQPTLCQIAGSVIGTGSAARLTARPLESTDSPSGYYEYLPPGYGQGAKKPLLIFLHGGGESGDGSAAQLPRLISESGIPFYISVNGWPADRPFVVLSPQHNQVESAAYPYECEDPFFGSCVMKQQHDYGNPLPAGSACTTPSEVRAFLDYALTHYDVDPTQVYLTGLSCGGYGVWESLSEFGPGRIAAAVPISGEGRPAQHATGCTMASVPIWAFTGDADDVVNPAGTIDTTAALQSCPAPPRQDIRLTVYPGVGHDAWNHVYSGSQGQDIYTWMLGYATT